MTRAGREPPILFGDLAPSNAKLKVRRGAFGKPASADTHRNGGDAKQAPFMSGAVPKADAQ